MEFKAQVCTRVHQLSDNISSGPSTQHLIGNHQPNPSGAEGIEYSTANQLAFEAETDWDVHQGGLVRRNEQPLTPKEFDNLHQMYLEYKRKYRKPSQKALRERLEAGRGTTAELEEYRRLKDGANAYRRAARSGGQHTGKPYSKGIEFTREEIEVLHEKSNAYQRRYTDKEERARLRAGHGTPQELAEYNDLHDARLEYRKWEWRNKKETAGEFSCEELEDLKANREGYLEYDRRFRNTKAGQAKKVELEAGRGTPEELREFAELRQAYRNYHAVIERHVSSAGKGSVEVYEELAELALQLEALRPEFLEFRRKFWGPKNKQLRERLKADRGTPKELDEFRHLRQISSDYASLYREGKARARGIELSSGQCDSRKVPIEAQARSGYFARRVSSKDSTPRKITRKKPSSGQNASTFGDRNRPVPRPSSLTQPTKLQKSTEPFQLSSPLGIMAANMKGIMPSVEDIQGVAGDAAATLSRLSGLLKPPRTESPMQPGF